MEFDELVRGSPGLSVVLIDVPVGYSKVTEVYFVFILFFYIDGK